MSERTMHTKGPWTYIVSRSLIHIETPNLGDGSPCGEHIASVPKSREANAHLIAAAPELLEALKLCLQRLEWARMDVPFFDPQTSIDAALSAIAKAEGRS